MNDRWSYKVIEVGGGFFRVSRTSDIQAELDRHGAQGWELVNMVYIPGARRPQLIFKRPA